jgi:hypothetical protein
MTAHVAKRRASKAPTGRSAKGKSSGKLQSSRSKKVQREIAPPVGPAGFEDPVQWPARTIEDTPENRRLYGELLTRYKDLPAAAAANLIVGEITGRVRDLRLSDVLPKHGPKDLISGEAYKALQADMDAAGGATLTPLAFLQVVYRSSKLPLSIRMVAAVKAAPYVHPTNPEEPVDPNKPRNVLIIGSPTASRAEWEEMSKAHHLDVQRKIAAGKKS